MRIISAVISSPVLMVPISTPESSCPPCRPIEQSNKIEKMRMTGSGISRSERISVAKIPNKNAMVTGETRLSYNTLSIESLVLFSSSTVTVHTTIACFINKIYDLDVFVHIYRTNLC